MDQKDYLLAGRTPPPKEGEHLSLRHLCNRFLNSKRSQMLAGELTSRTWEDYRQSETLLNFFGRHAAVSAFRPGDFDRFRAKRSETKGPIAPSKSIICTRIIFKWRRLAARTMN